MSVALQIRDVPEEVRDRLAELARARGQSMQAYLLALVEHEVRVRSRVDMFSATADIRIDVEKTGFDPVAIVREGRDGGFEIDRDDYDS